MSHSQLVRYKNVVAFLEAFHLSSSTPLKRAGLELSTFWIYEKTK